MQELFFVKVYKTHSDAINKYDNHGAIELIADRESAFDIYFHFTKLGYKHIDAHSCTTGIPIDFEYGMWGKTKPLNK